MTKDYSVIKQLSNTSKRWERPVTKKIYERLISIRKGGIISHEEMQMQTITYPLQNG